MSKLSEASRHIAAVPLVRRFFYKEEAFGERIPHQRERWFGMTGENITIPGTIRMRNDYRNLGAHCHRALPGVILSLREQA